MEIYEYSGFPGATYSGQGEELQLYGGERGDRDRSVITAVHVSINEYDRGN